MQEPEPPPQGAAKSERLGLFGGSFDPIHHGHLIAAREALEALQLDAVIFLPAAVSPHKLDQPPSAPPESRFAMIRAAIDAEPGFRLDDRELRRTGTSFTIDTAVEFRAERPGAELYYFIGADNLAKLGTWRRIEELKRLARFVVLAREADADAAAGSGFPVIERRIEISSTEVRNRVARGLSIRYLVPESVCEIIAAHRLYLHE